MLSLTKMMNLIWATKVLSDIVSHQNGLINIHCLFVSRIAGPQFYGAIMGDGNNVAAICKQ